MPHFTFELSRNDEPPVVIYRQNLPDNRSAWCRVEFLACGHKSDRDMCIRVRDREGVVIIRTGVATALASIEQCPRTRCPLRRSRAESGALP